MYKTKPSNLSTLTEQEKDALIELNKQLSQAFIVRELIIFGSKARGDFSEWSDLDVLVLVEDEKNWHNHEVLSDIVYDINLHFDTQLACTLENIHHWNSEDETVWLPLKDNIVEEGVAIEI